MSITRTSSTRGAPGVKVIADTLDELNSYIRHLKQGEIGVVDGKLYYKEAPRATEFSVLGELEASGTIATEDVLTLFSSPIEVIPAPGAGRMILVDEIQLYLDHNTTDYVAAAGEDLSFEYHTTANEIARIDSDNGFITAAEDSRLVIRPTTYDCDVATTLNGFNVTNDVNKAVMLSVVIGNLATGDSPLLYKIRYRIVDALA